MTDSNPTDPLEAALAQAARTLLKKPGDIDHEVMVFLNAAYAQGWCLVPFDAMKSGTVPMRPREPVPRACHAAGANKQQRSTMAETESSPTHIEVSFKANGDDITCRYAVTAQILRQAQIWSAEQKPPATAAQTNNWFEDNDAKLDSKLGPAYVETRADGSRMEKYFRDGKLDRADGPAYVETRANGYRYEGYFHDGKLDRADGPAYVETRANGIRIEDYYRDDKRDRADGPAVVVTYADGTRIEKYYYDGRLDRADGPACVETYANGTRKESYYRDNKFIKAETLAPLKALPGVRILGAPPPAHAKPAVPANPSPGPAP